MIMADDRCYLSASAKNGGACSNRIRVARTLAETRILAAVKRDLRDQAVLEEVSRRFAAALTAGAVDRPLRQGDRGGDRFARPPRAAPGGRSGAGAPQGRAATQAASTARAA